MEGVVLSPVLVCACYITWQCLKKWLYHIMSLCHCLAEVYCLLHQCSPETLMLKMCSFWQFIHPMAQCWFHCRHCWLSSSDKPDWYQPSNLGQFGTKRFDKHFNREMQAWRGRFEYRQWIRGVNLASEEQSQCHKQWMITIPAWSSICMNFSWEGTANWPERSS